MSDEQTLFNQLGGNITPDEIRYVLARRAATATAVQNSNRVDGLSLSQGVEQPRMFTNEDLDNRFLYHSPTEAKKLNHESINKMTLQLAKMLNRICPPGPGIVHAMVHLQNCRMWANAAIACDS